MGYRSGLAMNCGVGHRCGSHPTLLWLWLRPAATAWIKPLAWEPPCRGCSPKKTKDQKNNNNNNVVDQGYSALCLSVCVHILPFSVIYNDFLYSIYSIDI